MTDEEHREHHNLDRCLAAIDRSLALIGERVETYQKEIQAAHDHMWEARRDMDHIYKIALRQSIDQMMRSSDVLREQHRKLQKLRRSPYFGRFDFARASAGGEMPHYVGIHDCRDEETGETLVYDWRAPVSSLFYDYEPGPAAYEAPSGTIRGEVTRKRQFRIRDGRMEFMLESGLNIVDDVLQEELARASDDGMKNIVATIQRDQNAIIRNGEAHVLIIQGVAGSGKTSIALHRIAFLLYRFKDSLTADDILIISPNRVFADYIGNVLPELGEETVPEIGMEALADRLLGGAVRFQTFFDQTARLLETDDPALRERIAAKASPDLPRQLEAYARHLEAASFHAEDWTVRRRPVPAFVFEETWRRYKNLPTNERLSETVKSVVDQIDRQYRIELRKEERHNLRRHVQAMVRRPTLRTLYREFYNWIGEPSLFQPKGGRLEQADVFPFIYLKMLIEGVENPYPKVKHLLVDEMQDYTPIQYAVLGRLFSCGKTILGDANQAVNPHGTSRADDIRVILRPAEFVTLNRSYRSTWEIMQFALAIAPNPDLIPMERHGEAPQVEVCRSRAEAVRSVVAEIREFLSSDHRSLAILAKTSRQAVGVHRQLVEAGIDAQLVDHGSTDFSTGILVMTPHLAKGLEFDRVVIFDASESTFRTEMDRSMLYVACTRAMHRLKVVAIGALSPFVPGD